MEKIKKKLKIFLERKTERQSQKDCYRARGGKGPTRRRRPDGAPKSHFNRTRSRQLQAGNMAAVPSSSLYISSSSLTK